MKKSLVALAVLAATGAYAQSSVTLYGRMDLGTSGGSVEQTTAATLAAPSGVATKVKSTELAGAQNVSTGSRLGVRGSEDLGGGLKANFQYEFRLSPDQTSATAAGAAGSDFGRTRLALLQVAGGFGSVTIGTYNNPFDDIRTSAGVVGLAGGFTLDRLHNSPISATSNAALATPAGLGQGVDARSTNSIGYRSPVFGGGFVASFGTSVQKSDSGVNAANNAVNAKTSGYIGSLGYANGPINVLAAYASGSAKAATAAVNAVAAVAATATTNGVLGTAAVAATSTEARGKDFAFKASYDFGIAVPYLQYESAKLTTSNALTGLNTLNSKSRGYEIGSTFPLGAFTPFIVFGDAKRTGTAGVATLNAVKTSAYQLGTRYELSKRTVVYAGFGAHTDKVDNTTIKTKASGYAIGLVHNF